MDSMGLQTAFTETLTDLVRRATGFVPNLLSAAVLLLLGWLVASLSRATIRRMLEAGMRRMSRTATLEHAIERTGMGKTAPWLASTVVYWVILLFFAAAAVEKLEMAVASNLVSRLAYYLPNFLVGVLLVFAAIVAGTMARSAIVRGGSAAGLPHAPVLARAVEILIVFAGVIVGIDQAGIESTLLNHIATVFVAALLGGVALAFGLGSGPVVRSLINSRYVSSLYEVGQRIRIDGVEGRILEVTRTGVMLDAAEGRVLVPANRFSEQTSVLISEE